MTERIEPGRIEPGGSCRFPGAASRAARGRRAEPGPRAGRRARRRPGRADRVAVGRAARRRRDRGRRLHRRGARGAGGRRRHVGLRLARGSHAGTGRGDGGTGRRRGPGVGATRPRAGRAGRRAGARRGRVVFGLHDRPADGPDGREGRGADRLVPAPARRPCGGPRRGRARGGAGEQVLRRPGRYVDAAAAGPDGPVDRRHHRRPRRRRVRDHELARPARRPRLGVPDRYRVGLGRRARPAAGTGWPRRPSPRRSSRAGTTW